MQPCLPYVSVDIETTGLNPNTCQVLEFGAVLEDWVTSVDELPSFHCYVLNDEIRGDAFALAMNADILRKIASHKKHPDCKFFYPLNMASEFERWLKEHKINHERVPVAGKNFSGFDRQFLESSRGWDDLRFNDFVKFSHRALDPAMYYYDPRIDAHPPSTQECMKRAGIPGEVAHTAIEDAKTVIRLIRHHFSRASDGALEFLKRACDGNHRIVSSGDLTSHQIAHAQAEKRFYMQPDGGFGWALMPWSYSTPKDDERRQVFEPHYQQEPRWDRPPAKPELLEFGGQDRP